MSLDARPPRWSFRARIRALSIEAMRLDYDTDRAAAMRREQQIHREVTWLKQQVLHRERLDLFDVATPVQYVNVGERDLLDALADALADTADLPVWPMGYTDPDPPPQLDDVRLSITAPRPGPAAGIAPAA